MKNISEKKVNNYFKKIKSKITINIMFLLMLLLISIFFFNKDIRMGIIYFFITFLYVHSIFKRHEKMKKLRDRYILKEKLVKMKESFDIDLINLSYLMTQIGIEREMIEYTENNFKSIFNEIKNEEDFKRLQLKIMDDYQKYKNLTRHFIISEQSEDVVKALITLQLSRNIEDISIIKNKHRELLKKYHPDNGATEYNKVTEINAAYNLLKKTYTNKK